MPIDNKAILCYYVIVSVMIQTLTTKLRQAPTTADTELRHLLAENHGSLQRIGLLEPQSRTLDKARKTQIKICV